MRYIRIRDLVHITNPVIKGLIPSIKSYCGISIGTELQARVVMRHEFDSCELCCECQAYEYAALKVSL
jgi:hypothetical protein